MPWSLVQIQDAPPFDAPRFLISFDKGSGLFYVVGHPGFEPGGARGGMSMSPRGLKRGAPDGTRGNISFTLEREAWFNIRMPHQFFLYI